MTLLQLFTVLTVMTGCPHGVTQELLSTERVEMIRFMEVTATTYSTAETIHISSVRDMVTIQLKIGAEAAQLNSRTLTPAM